MSTQSPPTPARAADALPAGTEDARFLAFAKENIGLLAGVASVPMLSSAAGALKPPMQMDQLTVLSSLLCIIVFAACFTMRGILGAAPKSRYKAIKAIPGVASLLITGLAIYLIATFATLQKQQEVADLARRAAASQPAPITATAPPVKDETKSAPKDAPVAPTKAEAKTDTKAPQSDAAPAPTKSDTKSAQSDTSSTPQKTQTKQDAATAANVPDNLRLQVILFLSIYPTLILALGLILVTNFTQQTARDIQTIIEQKLPEQAKSLFDRLELIGRFYDIGRTPGQKEFLAIGEELIEERNEILKKLSHGIIELGGAEALRMQQTLVKTFSKSFDAVSCRDLDFWVNCATDEMSREYFRLNLEALKRSDQVTRLLILSDAELARIPSVIAAIQLHERYGIGWAVVPYSDLDPSTREEDEELALDFGLYDDSKVAIYFRDYQNGARKLRAVFPCQSRRDIINRQRERHAELVAQCWLVSGRFLKRLENLPPAELTVLKRAAQKNALITARLLELAEPAQRLAALDPATAQLKDCFLFPNAETDIESRVREMCELRRKCADWSGPRAVASTAGAAGVGG